MACLVVRVCVTTLLLAVIPGVHPIYTYTSKSELSLSAAAGQSLPPNFDDSDLFMRNEQYHISKVRVRVGDWLFQIQAFYHNSAQWFPSHGRIGSHSSIREFDLGENEWITQISGRAGNLIDSISFQTNIGRNIKFGSTTSGRPFHILVPDDHIPVAFAGVAGDSIDSLRLVLARVGTLPPPQGGQGSVGSSSSSSSATSSEAVPSPISPAGPPASGSPSSTELKMPYHPNVAAVVRLVLSMEMAGVTSQFKTQLWSDVAGALAMNEGYVSIPGWEAGSVVASVHFSADDENPEVHARSLVAQASDSKSRLRTSTAGRYVRSATLKDDEDAEESGLAFSAIVGIGVGTGALFLVLGLTCYFLIRRSKRARSDGPEMAPVSASAPVYPKGMPPYPYAPSAPYPTVPEPEVAAAYPYPYPYGVTTAPVGIAMGVPVTVQTQRPEDAPVTARTVRADQAQC